MKEINDILRAWKSDRSAVAATVVRVEGSAYRRPGARMLVRGDGATIGSVSGGCLERDVVYRAGAVAAGGAAVLVKYDSISEEEAGPGASLGCGGTVEILIERAESPLRAIEKLTASRRRGIVISAIGREHSQTPLGFVAAVSEENAGGDPEAKEVLDSRASRWVRKDTADGWVDLFYELIEPPLELMIFGAGADAVPLAGFGRSLGWRIVVVDARAGAESFRQNFDADEVVRGLENARPRAGAAAVVMNHNWKHDLAVLRALAETDLSYLGVLGPRKRTERLLNRLGAAAPAKQLMHYPVGLDIGAETPQEVALAIVAEITAVLRGGERGSLRDKAGPIHQAGEASCPTAAW